MLRGLRSAAARWRYRVTPLSRAVDPADASRLVDELVAEHPPFHEHQGKLTSWSMQADTLRFIHGLLRPGFTTLETGCGQTTVIFAIAAARHVCVMPSADEATRVAKYCRKRRLPGRITFVIGSSDVMLPRGRRIPTKLDFVLIDGAHAFPAPIVDWHYTAPRLRIGGVLAVDDYKMPSVRVLHDFLEGEEEWELVEIVQNTSFFRKQRECKYLNDWTGQAMNAGFRGY